MKNDQRIFISFEGADGVGKSTHVAFYANLLKGLGHDVVLVREPGGTKIGEQIRNILLDVNNDELTDESELLLYLTARSQIVNEVIKPALEAGKIVLCDRFFDSTLAYQGFGRGMSEAFIKRANEFVVGDCVPSLTVLFYIPSEVQQERLGRRGATDRIESAGFEFAERVRCGFLKIAEQNPDRVKLVNTSRKRSEVAKDVIRLASHLVPIDVNDTSVQEQLNALDAAHER